MKQISDSLRQRQARQREETLSKVKKALGELSSEGYQATIKNLMERTGLSRSVFSKPHIKDFLAQTAVLCHKEKIPPLYTKGDVSKDYLRISAKYEKAKQLNEQNAIKIAKLQNELSERRDECELLRGKLHIIMQKCRINGIEITE